MQKLIHQIYSFEQFTLDLTRGCLLHGTEEIRLRRKSFEVLKHLVENNGRLISKDELIKVVWSDSFVTDDSLVQCLKDIRRALGDDAQQIIKTVPRRGYIFDKEVRENGAPAQTTTYTEETSGVHVVIEEAEETNGHEASERTVQTTELPATQRVSRARWFTSAIRRHKVATAVTSVTLAATVIAGVVFAKPFLAWWFKPPSIAVLPIVNATGDANNDYISDGLTESIITSLAQINTPGDIPRLRVTAHSTAAIFKGKEVEPRNVGRMLGVDTVLASKMIEQDNLWIIKFEMINVADGSVAWSKQYAVGSRRVDEFLAMQNEIPKDVAAQLSLSLSDADRQILTRRYTQNPQAFDAYLKGRAAFHKLTRSSLRKSIEYYQQAIDLDPNFALAYWGMGVSHAVQGGIGERPTKEADEKAIDLYQKALKIDNTLNAAKEAMELSEMSAWNWEAIEKAGRRHRGYAFPNGGYLIAMGRLDEQLEHEKRILSFEPYNPLMNFSHGNTLFLARRYDEAIAQYQKAFKLGTGDGELYFGPKSPWIYRSLGHAYIQKGMYREAIAELNKANELGEDSAAWAGLGYAYARSGQKDEAIKILNRLQERASSGEHVPPLGIVGIYIGLGDKDQAFVWLDRAFDQRSDRLRQIKTNPIYDPLRSDPRFTDLLRRMKLPT